jgi:hypothetical protein
MDEKKLTEEISVEIAKSIDGVIGSVMAMDLKTFKKALRELNKAFKSKEPIKNFSVTGPDVVVLFLLLEMTKL